MGTAVKVVLEGAIKVITHPATKEIRKWVWTGIFGAIAAKEGGEVVKETKKRYKIAKIKEDLKQQKAKQAA